MVAQRNKSNCSGLAVFSVGVSRDEPALTVGALAAAVAVCLGCAASAVAQQPRSDDTVEEVIVTGSRIVRRDLNAPSPVLTVDAEQFEQSSNVSMEYVLNQFPQFDPADTQFDSSDIQPTADNTPGTATLDLRGLGPSRSLVLLDGRRAQPVNAALTVDINTLPAAAIGSVEVISGGAASTYGPDAMAGVVNFILRRDFEGVSLNYQQGVSSEGDGEETRVDTLIGGNFDGGRGNAMVGLGYASRDIAYEYKRDFYQDRYNDTGSNPNYIRTDFPNYIPDAGNLPTQAAVDQVFPIANQSRSSAFFINPATGTIFRTSNALGTGYDGPTDAPYLIRDHNGALEQNNLRGWLSSPMERRSIFGRAVYDLTDDLTVFVQGSFNKSSVEQLLAPTPLPSGALVQRNPAVEPDDLRLLLDSRQFPDEPWRAARTLYWWPNRGSTSDTDVNELVVGIEGKFSKIDWTWEAYHQKGTTTLLTRMDNFVWEQRYLDFAAQPNYGQGGTIVAQSANDPRVTRTFTCTSGLPILEPYTWSPSGEITYTNGFELTQDCVDAISAELLQRNVVEQKVTEANMQGKLADLPAGELRAAFGISNRVNDSLFEPDPLFLATERAQGQTEVNEIYGEFLIPLFGDFELELGARYSDFETGDWSLDAESYKALFNWAATDSLRFRGGYQRANRVPNVAELYSGQTSQVFGWGATGDACMVNTLHPWGNRADNPNRAQVQELCRQLIYQSGGIPGQNDFDLQGADNYPNDGRALPHSYLLINGGNPTLEAEEGDTYTFGMVWQADSGNLSVSADWYQIQIDNVVGNLGFLSAYEQCFNVNGSSNPGYSVANEYCQRILRDPLNAEPLLVYGGNFNLSERFTSGIDFTVTWTKSLASGDFSIRSSANRLLDWEQPVVSEPDAPLLEYAGYGSDYDYRLFTNFGWARDRLSLGLTWRHLPETKPAALVTNPAVTTLATDSYNMFNMNGAWEFSERLRLRGGIDNLFDQEPPLTGRDPYNPSRPSNGSGVTDTGNYDVLGRRYYVGISLNF